ncbi:homoserine kinase [Kordiimonas marina]|uniref:homoserine kinase n=1 Tax=Kordiimonas marina TaxID=2872312 RepID=UPI001FF1FC4B|nr:homoserine kinase [Kordiimonas marina]MCJ9427626.1 homoserine kinase [Kordiimonas marina]
MAVYTHVDDTTLAAFLDRYDVGQAVSFKGIAEGVENSNYLLETTKGRYILTLYEKRANPADLPYFLDLMEHLAAAGLPAPLPIHDKTGQALQELAGRPACLISFLTGVSVDHPSPNQCASLGAVLAGMHKATETFQETRPNDLALAGWKKLAEQTADRADEVEDGLSKLIADEIAFLEANWPKGLPTGTIHADLFPDNILFSGDRITGVIDFYFACTDMLAFDIATCINSWCFDEAHLFVPAKAKRLTELYDGHRPLSAAEIDALPILCRGSALRFLLTRLYDWLNPVPGAVVRAKDPREYLKKLNFHRAVRDAADYVV